MKAIKILFVLLGVLVAATVALAVFLPFYFDPNDYKDQIAKAVQGQTGREFKIPGKLELRIFPWLGMKIGQASLGNAPGFGAEPFAEIQSADVGVKLMPLLRKQIEFGTVTLDGLTLHLAKNAEGKGNWEGLSGSNKEKTPEQTAAAEQKSSTDNKGKNFSVASTKVGAIEINNAAVTWDDAQSGNRYQLEKFNFSTGSLQSGQPFTLKSDFFLKAVKPALSALVTLNGKVKPDLGNQSYSVEGLDLKVSATGDTLPGGKTELELGGDIDFNLQQQTLQVSKLELKAPGLKVTGDLKGTQVIDKPSFSGQLRADGINPRDLLKSLGKPPTTSDSGVLSKASFATQFVASADSANLSQLQIKLDDTTLNGTGSVNNFTKPTIGFNLDVDAIDLDRYMPPAEKKEKSSGGDGDKAPAAATKIPVDAIRPLNLDGKLHVGKLKMKGLNFTDANLTLTAHNGVMQVQPLTANFYQGRIQLTGHVDANSASPGYALNAQAQNIKIDQMLKDMTGKASVTGTGNVDLNVTGNGNTSDAIKRSLNGTAVVKLLDGQLKGFNLGQKLRAAQALSKGQSLSDDAPQTTDFAAITATLPITNGVISNKDLSALSPAFRVNGNGNASLVSETIDYLAKVSVVNTVKGQGGEQLADLKNLTIPVRIHGNLFAPEWGVDLGGILKEKAQAALDEQKSKLQDKAKNKLGELLGGKSAAKSSTTSNTAAPAGDGTANSTAAPAAEKPKSDKEQLNDLFSNAFKKKK